MSVGKPERDGVPVDQCRVIVCPVSDVVTRACFRTHDFPRWGVVFDGFNEPDSPQYESFPRLFRNF
jgi:hypothetical protein